MAAKPPSGDRSDSFASDIKDASSDEYSLGTPTRIEPVKESTKRPEGAMGDAILRFLGIRKGPPRFDPDAIATQPSLWDSDNADEYVKLYIHDEWENKEAFDPSFRWTWREEKQVRRKVDLKIMVWCCVIFSALNIVRSNITNAVSDNMLDELNLSQADYNLGSTIFKVGFLTAELPSQLISKRMGPDRWIPLQVMLFSIISAMQFFLSGRTSFFVTRYLISAFQGGIIPDTILYLSYWYTGRSLPVRLAWFWMSANMVSILTGFWSVGLLSMRGILGYSGWRWLFLIEGIVTFLIGAASFLLLPTAPAKTKSSWFPKGYFNDREVKIIVNSVIRDDPGKAGMHNRQPLSIREIWNCMRDYDLWPMYILGLLFGLPKYPVSQYLTLSFRGLGFSVIMTNLLTVPQAVAAMITNFGITTFSELVDNRSFVAMAQDAWLLPCFIALVAVAKMTPWGYFAISTVLLSAPYTHAIQVGWTSRNSGTVQTRTVSASLYNMFVQASAMIGSNIYQASDKPRYLKANRGLIALCFWLCFCQYPLTYVYYTWRNRTKQRKWDAMTDEEREHYLKTTTDVGNKRLDFRFAT